MLSAHINLMSLQLDALLGKISFRSFLYHVSQPNDCRECIRQFMQPLHSILNT